MSRVKALLAERPPLAPLTTAEGMVTMPSIPPNGRTRGRAGLAAGGEPGMVIAKVPITPARR